MKSILNEKGILTVELGESWLSQGETETLKPGDMVKLNSFAGEQVIVRYNGCFMGTGEVVIIDNSWAVRLEGVVETPQRKIPLKSHNLTEFLPVTVRLGTLPISLHRIKGLGVGSVINLDIAVTRENGELFIAGHLAATGEIAVIYDNFALSILNTVYPPQKVEKTISGNLLEAGYTDNFRIYNFQKPDMFSRLAICKIRDIHKKLLKSLKNRYPQMEKWTILSLDEQNFSESFENYKQKGRVLTARDRHYSVLDDLVFSSELIQPDHINLPHSNSEFKKQTDSHRKRILSEEGLIYIVNMGEVVITEKALVSQITACWRHLTDFSFTEVEPFTPFEEKKEALDGFFHFGINVHLGPDPKSTEGLYILYPFNTLSPVNRLLSF